MSKIKTKVIEEINKKESKNTIKIWRGLTIAGLFFSGFSLSSFFIHPDLINLLISFSDFLFGYYFLDKFRKA